MPNEPLAAQKQLLYHVGQRFSRRCTINRQIIIFVCAVIVLAMLITSCGGSDNSNNNNNAPVRRPTRVLPTPTLRSTPLPEGPGAPVIGSRQRPIQILFALPDASVNNDTKASGTELEGYIEDELNALLQDELGITISDLTVVVDFVSPAAALDAVCGRTAEGNPTLIWVNSFSAVVAHNNCEAEPALAITRSKGSRASVGRTAEIIARPDVNSLADLTGRVFCRSDEQDVFTSWVFPGILLSSQNVDPFTQLSAVNSYPTDIDLMLALYKGDCAAASIPADAYDGLVDDLLDALDAIGQSVSSDDVENTVKVLIPAGETAVPTNFSNWDGYASNVVPYETLLLPPQTIFPGQPMRALLVTTISDFFTDSEDGSARLRELLDGASGIIPVTHAQFDTFAEMLSLAKWDMVYVQ